MCGDEHCGLCNGADGGAGSLNDGNAISCIMTSNAACPATPIAVSNTIFEQVKPTVNPSLNIAASTTNSCSGMPVSFTATAVNGGSSPAYQWLLNGGDVGSGKSVFTTNDLANGDVVSCILTSSLSCSAPTASQNQVPMTVNPAPSVVLMPDTIIALGQSILLQANITGPVTSYEWTPANGLDNPNSAEPAAMPSLAVKISGFVVFDRWGTRVFYTTNSAAGWDGTFGGHPQPTGTYVWMIEYEDLFTGKPSQARGTVILIR